MCFSQIFNVDLIEKNKTRMDLLELFSVYHTLERIHPFETAGRPQSMQNQVGFECVVTSSVGVEAFVFCVAH